MHNTDKYHQRLERRRAMSGAPAPVVEFPATLSTRPPVPRCRRAWARRTASADCRCRRAGPSPHPRYAHRRHFAAHHHERRHRRRRRKPARQARSTKWGLPVWPDRPWPARQPPATPRESGKAITHARLTARGPGAAGDGEAEASPAPRTVVTGVAAAIREIAKLRDEGF